MGKKQSSIDWLIQQLLDKKAFEKDVPFTYTTLDHLIHEAKMKHRKECFSFYEKGADDEFNGISNNAFEYYKEKFGIEDE